MKILVTGAAGFIGSHVSHRLLDRGDEVMGIDNLNNYYDVKLKEDRLSKLIERPGFCFTKMDITDRQAMANYFQQERPQRVVHMAAQAGVRYSLTNPHAYIDTNLVGFINILEGCRQLHVEHLVYASSSSVYGSNKKQPFSADDNVDHPLSLYAATKKANELMAHTYSYLYGLPTTGLRFFSAYGPWGRPDMALFIFTRAILQDKQIDVFNHGQMKRDFTYIDDLVECVVRVIDMIPKPNAELAQAMFLPPSRSAAPYKLYNVGHHHPTELLYLIELLEKNLGRKAKMNLMPMQPGDIDSTFADVEEMIHDVGFRPATPIEVGVAKFVEWYRSYYPSPIEQPVAQSI